MNVLVTGGAGYIGSVCAEKLLDSGHTVTILDNLTEGHRSAVDPRAQFFEADLANANDVSTIIGENHIEAVIHFAANALVGESMTNPGKYFRNNVACGINLLEALVTHKVRKLVFSSTCATYGVPDTVPITESLPQSPVNPYGESKLMFERMLHWYGRIHQLEYVAFRYFNAAGATEQHGEHHRIETHLIPNVLKVALGQKEHCEIYGTDYPTPDGTCIRDYIHVVDLAEAHILALQPGIQGAFNLGTGTGCSVRQIIRTCEEVTGKSIPTITQPRRIGDPPELVASPQRTQVALNWKPRFTKIQDIIGTAWNWHKAHPQGYAD
ncbi:MAG: UDP-glucose 4-epimerase GalE [Limisphaerales bacterium]|jgi:UDP-glucose 4-epimerase